MKPDTRAAVLIALGIILGMTGNALAAIDFTPLAVQGLDLTTAVLVALAGWISSFGVKWLSSKTRLNDAEMETVLAQRLNDAILYGVNLAAAAARKKLADNPGVLVIQIDNPFVEIAAGYVMSTMPDILKRFGWTPEQVKRAVITRAENYLPGTVATTAAILDLEAAKGAVAAVR